MISESLQEKIRMGDEDAFRRLYGEYSGEVFRSAKAALRDEAKARDTVKTVMVSLYREMCDAGSPVDTDARTEELTRSAIAAAAGAAEREQTAASPADASPRANAGGEKKRSRAGDVFATVGTALFCAFALWSLAGMLMAFGVLPVKDLGYSFFDSRVFPLFLLD